MSRQGGPHRQAQRPKTAWDSEASEGQGTLTTEHSTLKVQTSIFGGHRGCSRLVWVAGKAGKRPDWQASAEYATGSG